MIPQRESGQVWEIPDGRQYLILEEVPASEGSLMNKSHTKHWCVFDAEDRALYVWSEHQMVSDRLVCASPPPAG